MGCGSSVTESDERQQQPLRHSDNETSFNQESERDGFQTTDLWIPTNTNPGKLVFRAQDSTGAVIPVAVDSMFGTVKVKDQVFTLDAQYDKSIFATNYPIGSTEVGLWGAIGEFQRDEIPPLSITFKTPTELAQFMSVTTAIRHGIGSAPGDLQHRPMLHNQGNTRAHDVGVAAFVCGETFDNEFEVPDETFIIILLLIKKTLDIDSLFPLYESIVDCSSETGSRLVVLVHSNSIQQVVRVTSKVIKDPSTTDESIRAIFKLFDTSICIHACDDLTKLPSTLCTASKAIGNDVDDDYLCNYVFAVGKSPFTAQKPSVNTLRLLETDNWSEEVPNDPLYSVLKLDAMSFRELSGHTSKPVNEISSDPMSPLGWPYRVLVSSNKKGLQAVKCSKYEINASCCKGLYEVQVTEPCLHRCVTSPELIPKLMLSMEIAHLPVNPLDAELVLRACFFEDIIVPASQLSEPLVIAPSFGTPAFIASQVIHVLLRSKTEGSLAQGMLTLSGRRANEAAFTIDLCKFQRRACSLQGRIKLAVSPQAMHP